MENPHFVLSLDQYIQLAESYRDQQGRTRQRVIVSLGRKDRLSAQLDALLRLLDPQRRYVASDTLAAQQAPPWGRVLALRELWRQLGVETILDQLAGRPPRGQARLANRVLVLVAKRFAEPSSEHGLARWLEKEFVCDRAGAALAAGLARRRRAPPQPPSASAKGSVTLGGHTKRGASAISKIRRSCRARKRCRASIGSRARSKT